MMEGRPIKFRILEVIKENGGMWNCDVISKLKKEYDMETAYGGDCINFDMIELTSAGMIKEKNVKIDETGLWKKDSLLIEYIITQCGIDQFNELTRKVMNW